MDTTYYVVGCYMPDGHFTVMDGMLFCNRRPAELYLGRNGKRYGYDWALYRCKLAGLEKLEGERKEQP